MRNYLITMRKKKKWTQTIAAEKCRMSQSYYSAIENAERQKDMTLSTFEKLSAALDMPIADIIEAERGNV